ncbi:MurR/RpiR family transcriptional regulator [Vagococcus sp. JNUCC 83]
MAILEKLNGLGNTTPNEKALIDYILTHSKEVIELSPKELSEKSFVSIATVYRLLKKINQPGFNEFKVALAQSISDESSDLHQINIDYPINKLESTESMIEAMDKLYQKTLLETKKMSHASSLKEAVDLMLQAKQVDIYTSAGNIYFAQNFQFQVQEIGHVIQVPEEDYLQRLYAANSTPEHVALVISYGGRAHTTQAVVELLVNNQTPIILITSAQQNRLVEYADIKLYMSSVENHYNKLSSFSTRFSLLMTLDLLYAELFSRDYERNLEYKVTNYQKMNTDLI